MITITLNYFQFDLTLLQPVIFSSTCQQRVVRNGQTFSPSRGPANR